MGRLRTRCFPWLLRHSQIEPAANYNHHAVRAILAGVCTVWAWERAQGPAPAASKSRLNATNSCRSRAYSLSTPSRQSSVSQDTHEAANTQTYPDTPRYSYRSSLRRRAPQCSPSSAPYCFALLAAGLVWHPHSSAIGRGCCSVCPPGLAPVNHIPYAPRTLYGAWAAGPWSGR
jgi:hypothetical protein